MSTMPMPVPVHQFMIHPIQVNNPIPGHHHHQPSLDSAHSVISPSNNLSPSNHSTISSIYPNPSTAGTSPVSNFQMAFGAPGINNPPTHSISNNNTTSHYQTPNPNSTTRVLLLSDFNKELKTRDIQHVFSDWEDDRGGFKIKWVDDTSCLIVFADPGVAKRAFLGVLANPPASLITLQPDGGPKTAKLTAYNRPDVPNILASVQNRPRSRSTASQSLHSRASSATSTAALGRRPSMGTMAARNRSSLSGPSSMAGRAGGPLGHAPPSQEFMDNHFNNNFSHLPPHSTNGFVVNNNNSRPNTANSDKNISNDQNSGVSSSTATSMIRPRIDDAGKRFITSGLSKPGSGITQQPISELDEGPNMASHSLANLTIEEENLTPTASSH